MQRDTYAVPPNFSRKRASSFEGTALCPQLLELSSALQPQRIAETCGQPVRPRTWPSRCALLINPLFVCLAATNPCSASSPREHAWLTVLKVTVTVRRSRPGPNSRGARSITFILVDADDQFSASPCLCSAELLQTKLVAHGSCWERAIGYRPVRSGRPNDRPVGKLDLHQVGVA